MMATDETETVKQLAERHALPEDAVRVLLDALRRSGGTMAQFSHPALGGFGQWSGGMIMIGDMFNDQLKAQVIALAADLSAYVQANPPATERMSQPDVSYQAKSGGSANWWPAELGAASSAGAQNNLRYAVFPSKQRLAIEDGGQVTLYETADHQIGGVAQAQGSGSTLTFTSQHGTVRVNELKKVDRKPAE